MFKLRLITKLCYLLLCSIPLLSHGDSAFRSTNLDDASLVYLNVLVLVREENQQIFLHGAEVQIEPLSRSQQLNFQFPRSAVTGNGGLAKMGLLPASAMVGNYRVTVNHRDCGTLEKRSFSLEHSARSQTLSMSFSGSCGI